MRPLRLHPGARPGPVGVRAGLVREAGLLRVRFAVSGAIDRIVWPAPAPAVRTDGLWQATCFELFARAGGPAYAEANWSPSGAWASYVFSDYRAGMADGPDAPPPSFDARAGVLEAAIDLGSVLDPAAAWAVGLSAVIVTADRRTRHFALAHPPGPPDFHHGDCFVWRTGPAGAPC